MSWNWSGTDYELDNLERHILMQFKEDWEVFWPLAQFDAMLGGSGSNLVKQTSQLKSIRTTFVVRKLSTGTF